MAWIFLSPHLDDAVYSCGGLISNLTSGGEGVEIWTIFAGDPGPETLSPFAASLHARWKLGLDGVRQRREEDLAACRVLGAAPRHFSYLDCIYRQVEGGIHPYASEEDIFGGLDPRENRFIAQISRELRSSLSPGAQVVAPLGIGGHVDHELVRKAVRDLELPLWYYADFPYASGDQGSQILNFMRHSPEWEAHLYPLNQGSLELWTAAAGCYQSQTSTFWRDTDQLEAEIRAFSGRMGGVTLWKSLEKG